MTHSEFINRQRQQQQGKKNRTRTIYSLMVLMLSILCCKELPALQRSPLDEQTTIIKRWVNDAGFEVYAIARQEKKLNTLEVTTVTALEALLRTNEAMFYRYLAKSLLTEAGQAQQQRLSNIIQYDMELKASAIATYQSLIQDADETTLVPWLQRHIDLKKYQYMRDDGVYSSFFYWLAVLTINDVIRQPDAITIEYAKETKGKRRAFLKVLSQILKLRIYDINIDRRQVLTIVNLEPDDTTPSDLTVRALENSQPAINELLNEYFTVKPAAIMLMATPKALNFILPLKTTVKSPQSNSSFKKALYKLLPGKQKKSYQDTSEEPVSRLNRLMIWLIQAPITSIGLFVAAGVATALFVAYAPIPYNPFVFPPGV